jgi:hypothetical protein
LPEDLHNSKKSCNFAGEFDYKQGTMKASRFMMLAASVLTAMSAWAFGGGHGTALDPY